MDPVLAAGLGIIGAVIALLAMGVSIWQAIIATVARNDAKTERIKATEAADEVRELTRTSTAATVRLAEVGEEKARVEREQREAARFQLARVKNQQWRPTNVGPTLYGVRIVPVNGMVHVDEDSQRDVLQNGDSVLCVALAAGGIIPRAAVEFFLDEARERPGRNEFPLTG